MKKGHERGATLMEFIFASFLILFSAYCTIEITRILTFKNKLHTVAVDIAQQIAHQQLYLEKLYKPLNKDRDKVNEWISEQARIMAKSYFSAIERSDVKIGLRVNPEIVLNGANAGVYLQLSACYSFAFSPSLSDHEFKDGTKPYSRTQFIPIKEEESLKSFSKRTRNCFGEVSLQPTPQMQVYERAFSPWPANSEIYKKGIPEGKNVIAIHPPFPFDIPLDSRLSIAGIAPMPRELPSDNSKIRIEEQFKKSRLQLHELLDQVEK